ncbi:hypothetical protein GCM10027343_42570 [Noviherbaspirillum agri]
MPSNYAFTSKLRIAFRWFAISFLIVAATWLAAIFWWQLTQRAVSTTDAILHMVVLPIALLLTIALARRALTAKASPRRTTVAQNPEVALSDNQTSDKNQENHAPALAIVGAWASTCLSPYGDELPDLLNERRTRPTPDESLLDDHGFPLLSGRTKELDTDAVETALATVITGSPDAPGELTDEARDALLRALALLDSVLAQMSEEWPRSFASAAEISEQDAGAATLRGLPDRSAPPGGVNLQVKLLLSDELNDDEVRSARAYIAYRLAAYGISASQTSIDALVSDDAPIALALAEEFRRTANSGLERDLPQALLLLSGVSHLCPSIAETWESKGLIFSSQRPNGRMLGEAAFAILCANKKALAIESIKPMCNLSPVVCAQRNNSDKEKLKADVLGGAIHNALDAAKLAGDAIGSVICDADHRSDRTLESIGAMVSVAPTLDAIRDRVAIEESCGHLGAASALGVLAVGAITAEQAMHPVLLFNVGHPAERAAALLHPTGVAESGTSTQLPHAA